MDSKAVFLKIAKEEDRIQVAAILVKNGYTVRTGKYRKDGKSFVYGVQAQSLGQEVPVPEGE